MRILLLAAFTLPLFAQTDCNQVFETRKNEMVYELDRLDRAKAELSALQEANARVLGEKEATMAAREKGIDAKLAAIEAERAKIEQLTKKNQEILRQITESKDAKVVELYSGMKASAAGEIMNNMDPYLAAKILTQLDSKVAAGIIARIEAAKAAQITTILQKGPPFEPENNATTQTP